MLVADFANSNSAYLVSSNLGTAQSAGIDSIDSPESVTPGLF